MKKNCTHNSRVWICNKATSRSISSHSVMYLTSHPHTQHSPLTVTRTKCQSRFACPTRLSHPLYFCTALLGLEFSTTCLWPSHGAPRLFSDPPYPAGAQRTLWFFHTHQPYLSQPIVWQPKSHCVGRNGPSLADSRLPPPSLRALVSKHPKRVLGQEMEIPSPFRR